VLSVIGDIPVDSEMPTVTSLRDARGDFVNLEDLSVQSPKMLLGVGFTRVFIEVSVRAL
jgi:hypothetical protein